MMSKLAVGAALLRLCTVVLGHGTIYAASVNDVLIEDELAWVKWHHYPTENGYIEPYEINTDKVICHRETDQGPGHIPVKGGDKLTLNYQWPEDYSHPGPVMMYMANCGGPCDQVNRMDLKFVKVQEMGLLRSQPKRWATDVLIERADAWDFILPREFVSGFWLIRMEIIALHFNDKQWYMGCINLNMTTDGNVNPPGIPATEFYDPKDPRFHVDVMHTDRVDSWPVPGPPLFPYAELAENQEINFRNIGYVSSSIMAVFSSHPTPAKPAETSVERYDSFPSGNNVVPTPTSPPSSGYQPGSGSGSGSDSSSATADAGASASNEGSSMTSSPQPTPTGTEGGDGGNTYNNKQGGESEGENNNNNGSNNGNEGEATNSNGSNGSEGEATNNNNNSNGSNEGEATNSNNSNEGANECKEPATVTEIVTTTITPAPEPSSEYRR